MSTMHAHFSWDSHGDYERWWVAQADSLGYRVQKLGDWEKPNQFCARVGITPKALCSVRHRRGCPSVEFQEGPSGRLIRIRPTPAFEAFCRLHKPGL